MAHSKPREEKVEMDMTPMIDVTFQLLIFFIITMKFRLLEKKLEAHLPTDFGLQANSPPVEENFVEVKLRQRNSDASVDRRAQATDYFVGREQRTLDELSLSVQRLKNLMDQPIAKIDVGNAVPHGRVVQVIDILKQEGFETISFVGIASFRDPDAAVAALERMRQELKTSAR